VTPIIGLGIVHMRARTGSDWLEPSDRRGNRDQGQQEELVGLTSQSRYAARMTAAG